jgi:ankyrin repeat protein
MKYLKSIYELNESVDYSHIGGLIENNDIDAIKDFIKNNDINKPFMIYHGCFHYVILDAIYFKNYEITKLLIESGANINVFDCDDVSALQYACDYNYLDITELLLENDADPNIHKEKTPLMVSNTITMINLLINAGADPYYISTETNNNFIAELSDNVKLDVKKQYPKVYQQYLKLSKIKIFNL